MSKSWFNNFEIPEEHLHYRKYDGDNFEQFRRNGRWGTCTSCPKIEGKAYPEMCVNTDRNDHKLTLEELVEHYRGRVQIKKVKPEDLCQLGSHLDKPIYRGSVLHFDEASVDPGRKFVVFSIRGKFAFDRNGDPAALERLVW